MTSAILVKCACDRCLCEVSLKKAIKKNDQYYCCEACANGHQNQSGCQHEGCNCG